MPKKIRMRERRKGGRGERRVTTRKRFSEMQGRKTATLLERTPMSTATAMMPKHLRDARVRPSPVHT